ncbi:MAG: YfhO family protein [Alistipes sp.]
MNFSNGIVSKIVPSAVVLLLFFVVSAFYFAPQFRGEVLPQHDVQQYEGMTKDIRDNRAATGEDPQWTGGMFGGMPAYLINVAYPAQLVKQSVGRIVQVLDTPAAFVFFAMTAMWLMLLMVGVNPWVGIVPALAYGLSTYFFLIIGAGHITKMWALVYAPLMMGGAYMTLRGKMWAGAVLTALFTSLEIGANHPQITYYFLLAMGAFWISEGVVAILKKTKLDFLKRTTLLAAAGLIAVGSNFSPLWYTAQHAKETMRGGSELTTTVESSQNGLALDYATAWSYGREETFNLLIPDFMGGQSATTFAADGTVAAVLNDYGLRGAAQQLPAYWGTQPYTGGPTYLGAVVIFLAVLGICLARGRNKWWIVGVSVLMIFLAWGHNMLWFTEFMFNYLPGYNKFRTVSMTLVVVEWTVPLLGALALMRLWRDEIPKQQLFKALAWAAGVTGVLCLVFAVAGGSLFDFGRDTSAQFMTDQFHQMFESNSMTDYLNRGMDEQMGLATAAAMATERAEILSADAWRSLFFILLAAACVAAFAVRRINKQVLVAALGLLVLADLIPVNLRFLSQDDFVSARRQQITATAADKEILKDTDPGYRVFNLSVGPFNDATTSYFHRSVGGYHGAKLARYQDIIDKYLSFQNEQVLDMLNTRYLIVPTAEGTQGVVRRETANGAAWFVDSVTMVDSPQAEIDALGTINTKTTAVVNGSLHLTDFGKGTITLTEYRPNYLKYEYTADAPALALFSEIFYDKGWRAFIDGVESPYLRADYILRAMELPAGSHTVEWRFRAPQWNTVEGVTLVCSLLILLGIITLIIGIFYHERRQKTKA